MNELQAKLQLTTKSLPPFLCGLKLNLPLVITNTGKHYSRNYLRRQEILKTAMVVYAA